MNAKKESILSDELKYICGNCGDHVSKVTFNEDLDIDECENCK